MTAIGCAGEPPSVLCDPATVDVTLPVDRAPAAEAPEVSGLCDAPQCTSLSSGTCLNWAIRGTGACIVTVRFSDGSAPYTGHVDFQTVTEGCDPTPEPPALFVAGTSDAG